MSGLFFKILYQPLFNGLVFLYNTVAWNDLGIAIILLTIVIRFVLFPLFYKSFKNQTILQKIHPEIQKIQHFHKDDKEKQAMALMELYRAHKVNPFSSILLVFAQLPVLIALYRVFMSGFGDKALEALYPFITNPGHLNAISLGLIDLGQKSIVIVALAAIAQYFQGVMSLPKVKDGEASSQQQIGRKMVYFGPVLTLVILGTLPSAVGLYWLASSLFSIVQQWYINKEIARGDATDIPH